MRKLKLMLVAGLVCLPMLVHASDKENYLGVGIGLASQDAVTDSGYTFAFQMQQAGNTAIGFAYQDSDKLTFTYKSYMGKYAASTFWEAGMLLNTYNSAVAPLIAVGTDIPMQGDINLSLTAGAGLDAAGVALVARAMLMFKM